LIRWYQANKRDLPWRNTEDPYLIWISEVMLQQTRVDQARPYFERFVTTFPTVEALASAGLDEVLLVWEGMGYYARARNLHRAAHKIIHEHNGRFPDTYEGIQDLPGIGPYTGAAILSIAFNRPHAVVDGNVARVLARVFRIGDNIKALRTRKRLQQLADSLLDTNHPGTFNQAMMELGATTCLPQSPQCIACPVNDICGAFQTGNVGDYPNTPRKSPIPHHEIAVGIIYNREGYVFIQRRPDNGLLGGLWEFPGGKKEGQESLEETCRREMKEELGAVVDIQSHFHTLSHAYTHFRITLTAFTCSIRRGTPVSTRNLATRWVPIEALDEFAFPRANRRLIEKLQRRPDIPTLFD